MKKSEYKKNLLIKRSGLRKLLKKEGIISISEDALTALENFGDEVFMRLVGALKEKLVIGARKVVKKEDVEGVVGEL
ncbi:MAG: hypothetical protein KKD18_05575 [Nanoarchaeota archaeon]|nr:hypothetical protein [Nanoarchaeota archaeon]MBU0977860.1 hypothetical protein [Nanoarchaeota archaeon]